VIPELPHAKYNNNNWKKLHWLGFKILTKKQVIKMEEE